MQRGVSQCRLCVSELFRLINETLIKCGWFLLGDGLTVVQKFIDISVHIGWRGCGRFCRAAWWKVLDFPYYLSLFSNSADCDKVYTCHRMHGCMHPIFSQLLTWENNCKNTTTLTFTVFWMLLMAIPLSVLTSIRTAQTLLGVRFQITTTERKTHTTQQDAIPDHLEIFKEAQVVAYMKTSW